MDKSFYDLASPYYILAPDYADASAGKVVLHFLCHALNAVGCEAYLIGATQTKPGLNVRFLTQDVQLRHSQAKLIPIIIYPEIVADHPVGDGVVVRYMLNRNGFLNGRKIEFADKDLLYYFSPDFVGGETSDVRYLSLPVIDDSIYYPANGERSGKYLYLNRFPSEKVAWAELPKDVQILSPAQPVPPVELAELLRNAEVLYSYERTGTTACALLCGCPVVYMQRGQVTEYPDYYIYGDAGSCFSFERGGLERARKTVSEFWNRWQSYKHKFWDQLELFVSDTQQAAAYFKGVQNGQNLAWVHTNTPRDWTHETRVSECDQVRPHITLEAKDEPVSVSFHYMRYLSNLGIKSYETNAFEHRVETWESIPEIEIILVVDSAGMARLPQSITSLSNQLYPKFHLFIIGNDQAPDALQNQSKITWINAGTRLISACNQRIAESQADWLCIMQSGDCLINSALLYAMEKVHGNPDLQFIYFDEDCWDEDGSPSHPYFKPDANVEYLESYPYIGDFLLAKPEALRQVGGLNALRSDVLFYDIQLKILARFGAGALGHIPSAMVRRHSMRVFNAGLDAWAQGVECLSDYLRDQQQNLQVVPGRVPGSFRFRVKEAQPYSVSVVIPVPEEATVASVQGCVEFLLNSLASFSVELLLLVAKCSPPMRAYLDALDSLASDSLRVFSSPGNAGVTSLLNGAAVESRSDLLLFMSLCGRAYESDWLQSLILQLDRPGVGMVGGRLIDGSGNVCAAAKLLGMADVVATMGLGVPPDVQGYWGRLQHVQTVSALDPGCALVARDTFVEAGGFDPELDLRAAFIDYSLRLSAVQGKRTVWTPYASLCAFTSDAVENAQHADYSAVCSRWMERFQQDPSYNINFSRTCAFELREDPVPARLGLPWKPLPRLLAHPADEMGCGQYRVIQPVLQAARAGLAEPLLDMNYFDQFDAALFGADAYFLQRQLTDEQLKLVEGYRNQPGKRLVYELDDLLTNLPVKNAHRQSLLSELPKRLRQVLGMCDCFTVTTAPLADAYQKFHDNIVVVPNYIDDTLWGDLSPLRNAGAKPRVGWVGGVSHTGDLHVMLDVIRATSNDVDWVFMGMKPPGLDGHIKEFHAGVPYAQYPQKFASLNLDLAIAPLEYNEFNECKSNLKLLEYGVLGVPVIATDITPYQCGLPVTLVKNRYRDWVGAIQEHVANRDTLTLKGDQLRNAVKANWLLQDHMDEWMRAWFK